jgi:NAD(P)-dependent dehydrogenase (short-subunit alcohol dehydrogenase family)
MFDLKGRVAVVTGSSRGIGRAIAEALAAAGASVVVSSRKVEACRSVVASIEQRGGSALAVPCNVSDREQLHNLVDETTSAFGRLDILVCNAAVNPYFGPMAKMPDEAYDKIMNSNVRSNFWLCNQAAVHMAAVGGGSIMLVSSIGGQHGSPSIAVYDMSKAADASLARSLAVEWGSRGIRANCIAPGLIKTDFSRAFWQDEALLRSVEQRIPVPRIGTPQDLGGLAVFLASEESSYLTGQTITVDGGLSIREPT